MKSDNALGIKSDNALGIKSDNALANQIGIYWIPVKDGDRRVSEMYQRHYSCYQYADGRRKNKSYKARNLVMGPGEKMVLIGSDLKAIFGWRNFIDASGQTGINCAFFRNEGAPYLSSELILMAENLAWSRWPGERLYTFVDAKKIKSTNPGYSFLRAGWTRLDRKTKSGLVILEKLPVEHVITGKRPLWQETAVLQEA